MATEQKLGAFDFYALGSFSDIKSKDAGTCF
jgi:hypothetical protein